MNSQQSQQGAVQWLSRGQLLRRLGIDRSTLYRWESQKTGPPFVRLGGRKFYPADALETWLIAHRSAETTGGTR